MVNSIRLNLDPGCFTRFGSGSIPVGSATLLLIHNNSMSMMVILGEKKFFLLIL